MSAYGYDDEGEREHDCCDRCGSGSCPGSGSRGEDACTYRRPTQPPAPEHLAAMYEAVSDQQLTDRLALLVTESSRHYDSERRLLRAEIARRSSACAEPQCDGDTHFSGQRDPHTNEHLELGPCPLVGAR